MAMTNAEKQAAFRQRRDARITELEAENERLRNQGGGAEIAELRRELAQDRQTLEWALDAIKLLKAQNKRLARGESIVPVQALGNFKALAEAKVACEEHARAVT
jgi:hypothetical protein